MNDCAGLAIFDMDDTLYPERDYVESGMLAVAAYLTEEKRVPYSLAEIMNQIDVFLDEDRNGVFDRLLNWMNRYSEVTVQTLVHLYRTHNPQINVFEEVPSVVSILRRENIACALITDGISIVQHRKICALHIDEWMDMIVCTSDIPGNHSKPSTMPYEIVLNRFELAGHNAVYIGDDTAKDFKGAKELGMNTIRVERYLRHPLNRRTNYPESFQPDKTVADLQEAVEWWLKKWKKNALEMVN